MTISKEFADALNVPRLYKRAQIQLGVSQAEFAKLLGVNQSQISRYQNGKLSGHKHILRLFELLGEEAQGDGRN